MIQRRSRVCGLCPKPCPYPGSAGHHFHTPELLMLFMNIVDAITTCAASATSGPEEVMPIIIQAVKRSFRKAFHATRDITMQVFGSITRMIKALPNLLTQAWKIPDLTDLWEDWTGQEFSILNLTTYGFALLTTLLPPVLSDTQVDAMFGKPITTGWTQVKMEPFYLGIRRVKDQAAIAAEHTDTVVVMVATGDSSSGKGFESGRNTSRTKELANLDAGLN
jgi:hypothetical protein